MTSPREEREKRLVHVGHKERAAGVQGFRIPVTHGITENERGWIELLRILSNDGDPRVTLRVVQALRQALGEKEQAS